MFENEKIVETKTCKKCSANFEITDKDLEFYEKVSPVFQTSPNPLQIGEVRLQEKQGIKDLGNGKVKYLIPSPTLCPDCRQQRRLAWKTGTKLYKRDCDLCGKKMIGNYSPENKRLFYCQECWQGDKWNPLDYGKDFDFEKSFFKQFKGFYEKIPNQTYVRINCENSDYTNFSTNCKNNYLCFNGSNNENCYYCEYINYNKNLVDCSYVENSENCFNSVDLLNCYNVKNSQNCENCKDIDYCVNCSSCDNCILCDNLVNKSYHIENKKYTTEEYEKKRKKILKNNTLKGKIIQPEIIKINTENVSGNHIFNSKNIKNSYEIYDSENISYSQRCLSSKNIYDMTGIGLNSEYGYELQNCGHNFYNSIFCSVCLGNNFIMYCIDCYNSSNLFGCIGLKNKQYCILNKQYTKEEYEKLVPKIIEKMIETGEWGEFFPASISPFGYNETASQEYFPLKKDEAIKLGFNWSDYEAPFPKVEKIIPAKLLPENIKDIPDDVLNRAIKCEITGKPFLIISQELEFYRKHNLPIPRRHPDQRHLDRMKLTNPRKLFDRKCDKCKKDIKTTYSPEREEIVYCEECYNKEIY